MTIPNPSPNAPLHVSVLIDRSGSMTPLREQVIEGVNDLFADQRVAAETASGLRITVVTFHSRQPFDVVVDAIPIAEICDLGWDDYRPGGGTPLLDAIGLLIERLDERPGDDDQLVAIITDGRENASSDYTLADIRRLIEARTEAGWSFLFLGANQDSFAVARRAGIGGGNTRNFAASRGGTARVFDEINQTVHAQRSRSRSERFEARELLLDERSDADDLLQ